MRNYLTLLFLAFITTTATAQVPRKVVVEHFTNTRCPICANRNPGFFANLNNFPDVLHLTVHPSSPYSSCVLNQHNVVQNDARTNYYGVYGGTPRLVIQGKVISAGADYNDAGLFSSEEDMMSNYSLRLTQSLNATQDSINILVSVKKEATDATTTAWLYVPLAEAELDYAAPNGETEQFNVFRYSAFGDDGMSISMPVNVGDSQGFATRIPIDAEWNLNELYSMAIVQDINTREVIQATTSESTPPTNTTGIAQEADNGWKLFPNPFQTEVKFDGVKDGESVAVYDLIGQPVFSGNVSNSRIDLSALKAGAYVLVVNQGESHEAIRMVKQ